ncbi:galactose-1-phosphate uridyl transferase, partial [Tilletia horrida]
SRSGTCSLLKEHAIDSSSTHALDAAFGKPSLLLGYSAWELSQPPPPLDSDQVGSRIIAANKHFLAVVPYWAIWPYEVLLLPSHRQIASLAEMTASEQDALAQILGHLTKGLDNIFQCSFPYSMGIHQRPVPLAPAPSGGV